MWANPAQPSPHFYLSRARLTLRHEHHGNGPQAGLDLQD
jgi:hypothetical protein